MSGEALLQLRNLTRDYGEGDARVRALAGVDLAVQAGSFVAIMGASGSGKSTMMNILGCLDTPTSGDYIFNGLNITGLDRDGRAMLRRHYLGFVFQGFNLLARTTALENVELPLIYRGMARSERQDRAQAALKAVGLEGREHHTPSELSGGQQQRVAIARAIVNQPDIIIADEPTGNLDPIATYEVVQILRKINDLGTTVVMTTHNKGVIDELGKRVLTMDEGRIIRDDQSGKYVL